MILWLIVNIWRYIEDICWYMIFLFPLKVRLLHWREVKGVGIISARGWKSLRTERTKLGEKGEWGERKRRVMWCEEKRVMPELTPMHHTGIEPILNFANIPSEIKYDAHFKILCADAVNRRGIQLEKNDRIVMIFLFGSHSTFNLLLSVNTCVQMCWNDIMHAVANGSR